MYGLTNMFELGYSLILMIYVDIIHEKKRECKTLII